MNPAGARNLARQPFEGGQETEIVEHGGAQKQGDIPYHARVPLGHILHQLQLAEGFLAIVVLDGRAQVSQTEHDRR